MSSGIQRETDRGERERDRLRDQARIVLTSDEGSGRAASSSCNARYHGSERRINGHTMEKGWVEGGCKTLNDWDWRVRCLGLDDGDRQEVQDQPLLDSSPCNVLLLWPLSHQLTDFLYVSHYDSRVNVSWNSTAHGCLESRREFIQQQKSDVRGNVGVTAGDSHNIFTILRFSTEG